LPDCWAEGSAQETAKSADEEKKKKNKKLLDMYY
jgi:hypothetical protein